MPVPELLLHAGFNTIRPSRICPKVSDPVAFAVVS